MTEKIAIVTGSARGIGAVTARRLASDGMAVAVLDLDEAACAGTVKEIADAGGRAIAVGTDVSDRDQVEAAVERVASELGAPGVLVNNAGVIRDNLLFKMTDDDWETVMGVHLRGAFLMTRAVQKHMVEQRWGRVVNLSSTSALGNRGQANYSAAKAGLQGFTKTLAIELGPFGDHRERGRARLHRHRHDRGHRGAGRHRVRRSSPRAPPSGSRCAGSASPTTSPTPSPSSPARARASSPARSSTSQEDHCADRGTAPRPGQGVPGRA